MGHPLLNQFYLDNYLNTYDEEPELITDKVALDNLMLDANMPLQEWANNNETFLSLVSIINPKGPEYSWVKLETTRRHVTYHPQGIR